MNWKNHCNKSIIETCFLFRVYAPGFCSDFSPHIAEILTWWTMRSLLRTEFPWCFFDEISHLKIYHQFLSDTTPPTKENETKNTWTPSNTVSNISKLKSPKKLQGFAHERFLQKFGGNYRKVLKKNRERLVWHLGRKRLRLPHTAPITYSNI